MKGRLLLFVLALFICLCAIPAQAGDDVYTATFVVGDGTVSTLSVADGSVALPEAPAESVGFCGWQGTLHGENVFLPAGATCTGISEDVTFQAVFVDFKTDTGCSVRLLEEQVALRFTSTIALDDYEALAVAVGGKDKIGFGTYIVPSYYVTNAGGVFTLEALAANGMHKYIDVEAGAFYKKTETTATVAGSVKNILKGNYTLVYTGIGYMKITYTDGSVGTVYAEYNQKRNSHSILKTVLGAYNDRDDSYGNLVTENDVNTHSPYTDTELSLMRDFLDKVVLVGHNLKYEYFVLPTEHYVSPWTITYVGDEYGRTKIYAAPPAGMTASDVMGIYLDGLVIALKNSSVEEGQVVFVHDSYVSVG